jgi:hypothetical protein
VDHRPIELHGVMLGENHMKRRKKEKRADSPPAPSTVEQPPPATAGSERVTGDSYYGGESNEAIREARLANRFGVVVIYKVDFFFGYIDVMWPVDTVR